MDSDGADKGVRMKIKCDDQKVLTITYLLTDTLNEKELLKVILLLTSWYFREREDKGGEGNSTV